MSRPQFTIRALLLAILVVATLAAYVAHTAEIVRMRTALRRRFHERDFCLQDGGLVVQNAQQLSWLRRMMSDRPVEMLFYEPSFDKTGDILREVEKVFPEAEILTIEEGLDEQEPPPIDEWIGEDVQIRKLPLYETPPRMRHRAL